MNERSAHRITRASFAASVVAALGASICCIGPILAATFGLTSLATLVRYEPLRPALTGITFLILGAGFFAAYRKRPVSDCTPGSVCESAGVDRMQRVNRLLVWIAAAIALAVLTFPTWSTWMFNS
jgi:mercuric ion transport protein